MAGIRFRVLFVFSLAYFFSFLFRGVNVGFEPYLAHEMGMSPAEIGTLTSVYFLGFALAQIPAGVLLDHYGARRVTASLLLLAAAGSVLFGQADSSAAMLAGRLLIGIGASVCLGGAFKATAQHFPMSQLTLVNGLVMAVGGLGGVAVGAPLNWLLTLAPWRTLSIWLGLLTAIVSLIVWMGAPKAQKKAQSHASIGDQLQGTVHILRSAVFWKFSTFCAVNQAVFYAMQSLWAGVYLRDVVFPSAPDASARAAMQVSILGFAFIAGNVGFGWLARVSERRGARLQMFSGIAMALFVAVQALIAAGAPLPNAVLWAAYGLFGSAGILTYAVLARCFPVQLLGRVNTTLSLLIFTGIFVVQAMMGQLLSYWPIVEGRFPAEAHQATWAALIAVQVLAAIWYFWPSRLFAAAGGPASTR